MQWCLCAPLPCISPPVVFVCCAPSSRRLCGFSFFFRCPPLLLSVFDCRVRILPFLLRVDSSSSRALASRVCWSVALLVFPRCVSLLFLLPVYSRAYACSSFRRVGCVECTPTGVAPLPSPLLLVLSACLLPTPSSSSWFCPRPPHSFLRAVASLLSLYLFPSRVGRTALRSVCRPALCRASSILPSTSQPLPSVFSCSLSLFSFLCFCLCLLRLSHHRRCLFASTRPCVGCVSLSVCAALPWVGVDPPPPPLAVSSLALCSPSEGGVSRSKCGSAFAHPHVRSAGTAVPFFLLFVSSSWPCRHRVPLGVSVRVCCRATLLHLPRCRSGADLPFLPLCLSLVLLDPSWCTPSRIFHFLPPFLLCFVWAVAYYCVVCACVCV